MVFSEGIDSIETGSSPAVPASGIASSSDTLLKWLGSFWNDVYGSPDLVNGLQSARGMRLCQLYLDALETVKLVDRDNAPVFHRERWFPIILRKSSRGRGRSTLLKLGDEHATIGPQDPSNEVYPEGFVFKLGSDSVELAKLVVYPLDENVKSIAACIVDNIAEPNVVLRSGIDFAVSDGCLVLREADDPFPEDKDVEPKFVSYSVNDPETGDDEEAILWACDAFVDKDYVNGYLGYAVGLSGESSEQFKRLVNAAWDTLSNGAAPKLVGNLIAAMCGLPTVKSDGERVVTILGSQPEGWQVVTDRNVYELPPNSVLSNKVKGGAVLGKFDFLEDSVRIYPFITDIDRVASYAGFGQDGEDPVEAMSHDIPVIDLPPAFIRSGVESGFSVGWDERPIMCCGFFDKAKTLPKLSFQLEGSEPDNDVFWNDVWSSFEKSGKSMAECFAGCLDGTPFEEGVECGKVTPIRFFLRQLVGANTLVITVRTDTIPVDSPLYDPAFFDTLRKCIPNHIRMYFIEHSALSDSYDLGDGGNVDDESIGVCVAESIAEEEWLEERDARRGFKARDRITGTRLVPSCPDLEGDY